MRSLKRSWSCGYSRENRGIPLKRNKWPTAVNIEQLFFVKLSRSPGTLNRRSLNTLRDTTTEAKPKLQLLTVRSSGRNATRYGRRFYGGVHGGATFENRLLLNAGAAGPRPAAGGGVTAVTKIHRLPYRSWRLRR